jgi:hypothetical protein
MYSSYSSLLIQKRDVLVDITEDLKILNKRLVLSEIPDTLFKVNIAGYNEKDYSGYMLGTKLQSNEFTVDYALGIVYFSESVADNSTVSCTYKGTGYAKYPASRVYFQNTDGTYSDFGDIGRFVVENNKFIYKNPVTNFSNIATTYPSPLLGWVVQVTSTNDWYRYDGTSWVKYQNYSTSGYANSSDLAITNSNVTLKLDKSSVTDNLTTTDATKPLSAKQGNVLKGLIDANAASISVHTTTLGTKADTTSVNDNLALKAPLNSPTFTGVAKAPTPSPNNNSTQIATTEYVLGQASTDLPIMSGGTAQVGTSWKYARADHRHPTDNSRAPLYNPNFTGTVTMPTSKVTGNQTVDGYSEVGGNLNVYGTISEGGNLLSAKYQPKTAIQSGTLLWSGALYPPAITLTMSGSIQDCQNGFMLVWSDYDQPTATSNGWDWWVTFIPKSQTPGQTMVHLVPTGFTSSAVSYSGKQIILTSNTTISGSPDNSSVDNNSVDVVLREVRAW